MRKERRQAAIALFATIVLVAVFACACALKSNIKSCEVTFDGINGVGEGEYDGSYTADGATVYFAVGTDDESRDEWAKTFARFAEISSDNFRKALPDVYISPSVMPVFADKNGKITVALPVGIDETTALGWLLWAQSGNAAVPYGVFYGLAAALDKEGESAVFDASTARTAGFLTDLQFPIYEDGNLTAEERDYARAFSRDLADRLLKSGKTACEAASVTRAELSDFLRENYAAQLTDFTFYPYSRDYEYKVDEGCFTYYVNREFNDFILPKTEFDITYDFLSDWLRDNAATTEITDKTFGVTDMPHIDVSLDDGLKSRGISGEAYADYIKIYSVGAFSHEYAHHALKQTNKHGRLSEVLPELHANTSAYSRKMWFYLFSGASQTFTYDQSTDEKESYLAAFELYKKKLDGAMPSADNFDFWLFADCLAALYCTPNEQPRFRAQIDSFYRYLANVYGGECVMRINAGEPDGSGKAFSDLVSEWHAYLASFASV